MGENDEWCQPPPGGLSPNGLLPGKAASVVRVLDSEKWAQAEERAAELIACIQPSPSSEERRNAVANYVQRLIMECFPCQVFTFGSVPLKTYLPDGDIDLTAFSENPSVKDAWAHLVRDMLEKEEKNVNAEFRVKEVQYIQAEVKIIKCLVENIVVDISFDQVGGLCTLCFLEEVDNLVKQNHLFKRSIILIKAWCYYESRVLGAHHGLISTYALETLVLYIFHVFNNSFAGPLEVLYRFLEFFSKFDWENFCVSLWGPVPISSLPVGKAEPPRKGGGDLLLSKMFLKACGSAYGVYPAGQENQLQPFISKHFNVIDPLRVNNNLGRSVNKGNFFRIRSAFSFGAKRLARLLDCPKEEIYNEVNQFFMNTWGRHGSGQRPDAAGNDFSCSRLPSARPTDRPEDVRRSSSSTGNKIQSMHKTRIDEKHSQHNNPPSESTGRGTERDSYFSEISKSQKNSSNVINATASDHSRNQNAINDKGQRSSKPEPTISNYQGRHLFARTRSSPELTEVYGEVPPQTRDKRASEAGKYQTNSARLDGRGRKIREPEDLANRNIKPVAESSSVTHTSSHQSFNNSADTNSAVDNDQDNFVSGSINKDFSVASAQRMEEQDPVPATQVPNGQFHVPVNFASGHFPFPIPPTILASMGYNQRNMGGVIPTQIPMIHAPWGTHMQIPQGLVSSPFAHYSAGGVPSNLEKVIESDNNNFCLSEINPETGQIIWNEQARVSAGFDIENGACEMNQTDDTKWSSSEDAFFSSLIGDSTLQKLRELHSTREESVGSSQRQVKGDNHTFFYDRTTSSRSVSVSRTSSVKSKTSSESSWDGNMEKVLKPVREKQTRKGVSSRIPFPLSVRGESVSELSAEADENVGEWSPTLEGEGRERDASPQPTASIIVSRHHMHGFDPTQTSGSDLATQTAPLLLGHGSQQRAVDSAGGGPPFAFYATGPPVPFVAMLPPFYNIHSDTGPLDVSNSHFNRNDSLGNIDSNKNLDVSADLSEVLSSPHSASWPPSVEPLDQKADILNGDFASHVQNLQYGRFCQNSRFTTPLVYPSPAVVPPAYLQNSFPWDGLERRLPPDSNVFSQLVSYGQPHLVTAAPPQSVSTPSANVYPGYADEMPRHRSGTGTYFPNPIPARDRQSTGARRGNYNNDRYDHHCDRDGNWNISPKARGSGRSHNRNQAERSSSRKERTDRHWASYRHEASHPSHHPQNGFTRPNSSRGSSANMPYGVYQPPAMRTGGGTSGGFGVPSVMLYAYDHNASHSSPAEQLEFGSLGPIGFPSAYEDAHGNEGIPNGVFEEPRSRSPTARGSSRDQPSSPYQSRGV